MDGMQIPTPQQGPGADAWHNSVTLEIEGREVEVDARFRQMTPEQQNATVEEIAQQMGITPRANTEAPPEAPPQRPGRHFSFEEGQAMIDAENRTGAQAVAGASGLIDGLPIVGPSLLSGTQKAAAYMNSLRTGQDYDKALDQTKLDQKALEQTYPTTHMAGEIGGAVLPMVAGGATTLGAKALGMTGRTLAGRAAASAASNAAISAADTAARGGDVGHVMKSGTIGGAVGLAFPLAGAAIKAATGAIGARVAPMVNAVTNPEFEAARRVGGAVTRDMAANPSGLLSSADEAVARQAGIPLTNVDRGGEVTRALARSVANQNPEARAAIENVASDRFAGQAGRAMSFLQKIAGGAADDIAYREGVDALARATNKPAYNAAFKAPQAQRVFTPGIQDLMQSPTFRKAVDAVPRRSADRGAVEGFKEIANPFLKNKDGAYGLARQADGSLAVPNLQFWDQVKINLDGFIGRAKRAGDDGLVRDLMGLKGKLVGELDNLVPMYGKARSGAAAFFGQENALDAGKAFARNPRGIPEAAKAMKGFSLAEREAFAVGHASEMVDMIRASRDRVNVINQLFKSEASRAQMQMVYGPAKAAEIEAYVRAEDIVDRLRGAMGNSTTARQLAEMGLGAGAGYTLSGGDTKGAILGAVAARGGRYVAQKAEGEVMQRMATMLLSDNPASIKMAVQVAAKSPKYMVALENLSNRLSLPARGLAVAGQQRQ